MRRFLLIVSSIICLFPYVCLAEQISTNSDIILNIPDKIYASIGYETNIYFENITDDHTKYSWDINADIGYHLERGYWLVPEIEDVGEHYVEFIATASDVKYKSKRAKLIVSGESENENKKREMSIIILGDSTTDNGKCVEKIIENFLDGEQLSIRMLGTRGKDEYKHEGRSGWNLEDYFTRAFETYSDYRNIIQNPFFNPDTETFDASYYFDETKTEKPDLFIISMGINDMFPYKTDEECIKAIDIAIQRIDAMITSIKEASPKTIIGISLTIPPNHSQDVFGKAYGTWQTRDRYKRNNALWVQTLITNYCGREENDQIYIIPTHCALDTEYNMGEAEEVSVNARNPGVKYKTYKKNGGVHPSDEGYWQIADAYTAFFKYMYQNKSENDSAE